MKVNENRSRSRRGNGSEAAATRIFGNHANLISSCASKLCVGKSDFINSPRDTARIACEPAFFTHTGGGTVVYTLRAQIGQ